MNAEQKDKPPHSSGPLLQERVDLAFSRQQRRSNYSFSVLGTTIVIVSGKHTGQLEVGRIEGPNGEALIATKLERTLIDIVVRPAYAGGIFQVLEAYRAAKEYVSTNKLRVVLKQLNYHYPYHQAIGFLMDRAGYETRRYEKFLPASDAIDFYLAHGLRDPEYNSKWKLFHPKGI